MRTKNCEVIRQELDELMLGETYSASVTEHLRECAACREFHEKQTRLRQIVGSLGTVSAPADFDFRLRARLANESNNVVSFYWPTARRGLAVAAMLVVFATGAILVRSVWNRPTASNSVATSVQTTAPEPPKQIESHPANEPRKEVVAGSTVRRVGTTKNERVASVTPKRPLATQDFSSERAQVINGQEPVDAFEAFRLDTSLQSFKVQLDDGRGNARTISVPTVSFGSQRMLQTANQYAPKRVW